MKLSQLASGCLSAWKPVRDLCLWSLRQRDSPVVKTHHCHVFYDLITLWSSIKSPVLISWWMCFLFLCIDVQKLFCQPPQNAWFFRLIVEPSIATDLPIRFRYIRPQVNSISDTIQYWYFSHNTDFALVMEKILRELMLQIQLWK